MSYIWFESILEAIGKKLNFESLSNLYGNSFFKDSAKVISNANPLMKTGHGQSNSGTGILQLAKEIKIVELPDKQSLSDSVKSMFGDDFAWAADAIKGDKK